MIISQRCSFSTFWVGYCNWFGDRAALTHRDAWQEAREQHGPLFPLKLVGLAISLLFLLIVAAYSAPHVVRETTAAGATSEHVLLFSQWGTVFVMSAVAGVFIVSKSIKILRFCHEMCERGRAIVASRPRTDLPGV
jgi:hypothetical protein